VPVAWGRTLVGLAITSGYYWIAYNGLVNAAENSTSSSVYIDLLGLTALIQLGALFHWVFWLLTLVVSVVGGKGGAWTPVFACLACAKAVRGWGLLEGDVCP
jgi:hypothetical protein